MIDNVGPHEICFTHTIDGVDWRFSRSPEEQNTVWKCNGTDYEKTDAISLEAFKQWLLQAYGLANLGGSFRELVGPFFRIFQKGSNDATNPLAAEANEQKNACIMRLVKLFGAYLPLKQLETAYKDADSESKVFRESLLRGFLPYAKNNKEYKQNEKTIVAARQRQENLERMEHDNLSDLDPLVAGEMVRIKSELAGLRRRRTTLEGRVRAIERDSTEGALKSKDFEKLLAFFPDANIAAIEEIEAFHSGLSRILKQERQEEIEGLRVQIEAIDGEIERLAGRLNECGLASNLTKAVLREYADVSAQIAMMEKANENYKLREQYQDNAKALKQEWEHRAQSVLEEIQATINEELIRLNAFVCGEETSVPQLELRNSKAYAYSIPNDTGAGSQARALALFDFAVLRLTPLPAISQDTSSLKQIEDAQVLKLLDLYASTEKQVFVALDKVDSYGDVGLTAFLEDKVVLRLSRGHELFGKFWARAKDGGPGSPEVPLESENSF